MDAKLDDLIVKIATKKMLKNPEIIPEPTVKNKAKTMKAKKKRALNDAFKVFDA